MINKMISKQILKIMKIIYSLMNSVFKIIKYYELGLIQKNYHSI